MPSPNPPGGGDLGGVAVISSRDAWAVGSTSMAKELILHWNGTAWRQVPSPDHTSGVELSAATAISASNVWAVGGDTIKGKSLILRWNGAHWSG